jgi:putative methionine-R-sulfoxide reductase with GAF domain
MLQAQVNYWNLQENVRHNKATEQLGSDTLVEQIRHNKETEMQGRSGLEIERGKLQSMMRSNDINYQNAITNARRAEIDAYNAQTNRVVGYGNLAVNQQNAESQSKQAQAAAQQALEAARKNTLQQQKMEYDNIKWAGDYAMRGVENLIKLGGFYGYGTKQ